MRRVCVSSYSKINLTLEVLGRRDDGFHEIDSVAQVIDLSDDLEVDEAPAGEITLTVEDAPLVPAGPENSVYRACAAFFQLTGLRAGARVRLIKRVPSEAGLGGGSANAAAALTALNELYGCGLSSSKIASIAATVGSDAPLFVCGGTVRMRGRGELIEPLRDAPPLDLVVLKPDTGVSTRWAYTELDRQEVSSSGGSSDAAVEAIETGDRVALLECMRNDFEDPILRAQPEVRVAWTVLKEAGAQRVLLAGSGAAVFGVFASRDDAAATASVLNGSCCFVARSLSRAESSPLPDALWAKQMQ